MIKKKRSQSLDNLNLTNPQRVAVSRILTSQKNKYKKLLHETHERLHIIADMTTSLEFWYNVNGNYEYVSRSSEALLGYAPEAFTRGDMRLEQLVHDDSIAQFHSDRVRALEGESGERVEYRVRTKTGKTLWVQAHWMPVFTRKGKHIGIRISLRDITEFKQCQYFSRAYEQLSLTIADEITEVGIFSLTPDGVFKSWNQGAVRLLGWEKEEIIGTKIDSVVGEQETAALMRISADVPCGDTSTAEVTFNKKGGGTLATSLMLLNLCNHEDTLHQITFVLRPA